MPSGLISMSPGSRGARRISIASLAKGSTERPWKDFDQSMCAGSSSFTLIDDGVDGDGLAVGGGGDGDVDDRELDDAGAG